MKTKKYVIGVFALVLALFLNLRYAANGYGIGKNIPLMVAVASDSDEPIPGGEYQEEVSYVVGTCIGYVFSLYKCPAKASDWERVEQYLNYYQNNDYEYAIQTFMSREDYYVQNRGALIRTITTSNPSDYSSIKSAIDSRDFFSSYRSNVYIEHSEPFAYTSTRISCILGGNDACTPSFHEWCHADSDSGLEPTDSSSELQNIIDAIR